MPIQFSNTNSVWASVLAETLSRLGLTTAIVCPGSRSAPLAVAFAQHPQIEAIPVLDERSAAFFALGRARQTGQPTALICTSGTAAANFFPAVIEAAESRVPLLVLTADRPPELRHCTAGQTIDQQKLYGSYPNWYGELAVPALDLSLLAYLRQTLVYAWERSRYPIPGVVHLNLPFRDPLAPVAQPDAQAFAAHFPSSFFEGLQPVPAPTNGVSNRVYTAPVDNLSTDRAILIAGIAQPANSKDYCLAIAHLAQTLGVPVLAEGLSPLRNYADLNPYLISTYDLIVRNRSIAQALTPDWVICVGELPTSKMLRQWLQQAQPRQWMVDPGDRNLDPLHGHTMHLRLSVEQWAQALSDPPAPRSPYLDRWLQAEAQMRTTIDQTFEQTSAIVEAKVAWLLSQHLPPGTPLLIANSMPVRDVECFWKPSHSRVRPFFNRGANGIDGTLSTALGMAHQQQSGVLLTGDLALLHDTNGFLLCDRLDGHLTIVLINNNGGGIFEMLPIAQFDPPFEEFFATPQAIDFALLCQTYGVDYELIHSWEQLVQRLNPLPTQGVRLLEVQCDRKANAMWRQQVFSQLSDCSIGL